jgi:SAM-dependent methyltransferase
LQETFEKELLKQYRGNVEQQLKMGTEQFFELLLKEINENPKLRGYYRFLDDPARFEFRKAYYKQRLDYIIRHISDPTSVIWDCGSGYGTTCIYLAINGFKSHGSTLEYYFKEIENRKSFWKAYGNMELFTTGYEDIFESYPEPESTDVILLQDTLHHLEPLQDALRIFSKVLKPGGKIILIEENGSNIIQNLKLFKQRGNKRIIEYYDEKLEKNIVMGNENIRSYDRWKQELAQQKLTVLDEETQYIRYFPPFYYKNHSPEEVFEKEQTIAGKHSLLRKYFFFGINLIVKKP